MELHLSKTAQVTTELTSFLLSFFLLNPVRTSFVVDAVIFLGLTPAPQIRADAIQALTQIQPRVENQSR